MNRTLPFLFILSVFSFLAEAKNKVDISNLTLKDISYQAIDHVLETQIDSDTDRYYLKGEWPTEIQSSLIPALVGVGKAFGKDQEASAFTTGSVINILAQIYLDNPSLILEDPMKQIPERVQSGINTFSRYESDGTYNFYPETIANGKSVRRPIGMTLFPLWYGFTNIPNDADTTSVVLSALVLNSKINHTEYIIPESTLSQFSQYTDSHRHPMFYNKAKKRVNTGAFMTWLYDEKNPDMPRFYFADSGKGQRIPFNKNDVDCVVNANILKMFALAKQKNRFGQNEACQTINDMILADEHATCGIYYPNMFNLSFVLGRAKQAGESCISESSEQKILQMIFKMQNPDGSWLNEKDFWKDPVLTTAFALDALMHYSKPLDAKTFEALSKGIHFLLKNFKEKNSKIYWTADNFFTATAIARSLIMWRSSAYTNAIVSSTLIKMHQYYPQYRAANYLDLNFEEFE